MEKSQYNLCLEVLHRLDHEDILKSVILIGSWCLLTYEDYFRGSPFLPGIRTRDIDILIPLPPKFTRKVDMGELLEDLDFVCSLKGRDGYMQFVHSDLMIEFIVPERGRGSDKPFDIPDLGVNAQPLRFMDFLVDNTIRLKLADLEISVPHPTCFALLKVIVSSRRKKSVKQTNDMRQAIEVMRALISKGDATILREQFLECPAKWQRTILKALKNEDLTREIIAVFQ